MWILWALVSALCAAVRRTNEKQLTQQLNHFTIGFMIQLLSLPVVGMAMVLHHDVLNPLHLGWNFWLPLVIISGGFYPLQTFFYLQSIKQGELSKVLPLQSLWPVFSILPAWLLLHELPSWLATVGIACTVLGVYVLGMKQKALHHPLQPFREEKASRYMIFTVILVTLAGLLDKVAVEASNPLFFSFFSSAGAATALYITLRVRRINEFQKLKPMVKNMAGLGALQGSSYTTYLVALATGPVAYVSAIRSANVLIGALLGIVLLKEKLTSFKLISFGMILLGGVLLAIGS